VALREDDRIERFRARDPEEMAEWCAAIGASAVAIDAPCKWRAEGERARTAERALAADRISCFSTPTLAKARGHAFYTWMFAGQELYSALAPHFTLYDGRTKGERAVCFETYPQAIACAFAGARVSADARTKAEIRGALLARAGIDPSQFGSIDEIDAALCALTARRFTEHHVKAYGDAATGFIIVPRESLPQPEPVKTSPAYRKIEALLPRLTEIERGLLRTALEPRVKS
jgi:predicted nuclease with RNAse H fold